MRTRRALTADALALAPLLLGLVACGPATRPASLPEPPAGLVLARPVGDQVLVVLRSEDVAYWFTPQSGQWSAPVPLGDNTPSALASAGDTLLALTRRSVLRSADRGQSWAMVAPTRETGVATLLADGAVLAVEHGELGDDMLGQPARPWLLDTGASAWRALPELNEVTQVWSATQAGSGAMVLGGPPSTAPDEFCAQALPFVGGGFGAAIPLPGDHCPELLIGLPDGSALALGSNRRGQAPPGFAARIGGGGAVDVPLPGDELRARFGATALADGTVMVVGGTPWSDDVEAPPQPLKSTWLLPPGASAWTPGPELSAARVNPAVVAVGGDVWVFGGQDASGAPVLEVEPLSVGAGR